MIGKLCLYVIASISLHAVAFGLLFFASISNGNGNTDTKSEPAIGELKIRQDYQPISDTTIINTESKINPVFDETFFEKKLVESKVDKPFTPDDTLTHQEITFKPRRSTAIITNAFRPVRALHTPPPVYPVIARKKGYEGQVTVGFSVAADGKVVGVLLIKSSGYKVLDDAALNAVKSWIFRPAIKLGLGTIDKQDVTFIFKLTD